MASRIIKLVAASGLAIAVAGGYFVYMANAAQAQGSLAQAPLNSQVQTPPAFIMALDNSGSMRTDETLFRTSNGRGFFRWSNNSFFNGSNLWTSVSATNGVGFFAHMTTDDQHPVAAMRGMNSDRNADTYGAVRSPEHNRAYFNPHVTYTPWLRGDESNDANASMTAAPPDPRGNCSTGSRCMSNNATKFADATYNFTTYRQVTEEWRTGFVMPERTTYYYDQLCNRPPLPHSPLPMGRWVTLGASQELVFTSNCTTTFRYYPARVYLSLAAPPPPGFNVANRVLVRGIGPSGANMYRYDIIASNFTTGGTEAVQNFANWWTYYGNRNRALIAGITNALKGLNNMRVASFEFVDPPALTTNQTMYDMGSPVEKATLIDRIRLLRANGGSTPSRRGTAYMLNQFHRTDAGAPIKFECQRNAAMLFTDGYTNESASPNDAPTRIANVTNYFDVGDQDHSLGAPYGGAPISGGVASVNTIADYAMWGYLTNPRPDLPLGRVPIPAACPGAGNGIDCNPNLHVNFYGVTLGARGAIYDVNMAATADPYANPPNWTANSGTNLEPANVDDIWHASINARGEFINANTPQDITDAMRRILQKVSSGASPSGSLAMTGARIGARSLSVVPSYEIKNEGTDWHSYLHASRPGLDLTTGEVGETAAWEASSLLTASGRGARTWYGDSAGAARLFNSTNITDLATFCSGNLSRCTAGDLAALVADTGEAIAYFLGDQSKEVARGGTLRDRTTVLGDIVNSTPVVSSPTDDYGHRLLPAPYGSSYSEYMTTKQTRPVMVYVGANDGMLHAFHGGIDYRGDSLGTGGQQQFAYIPRAVLGHMGNLLFPYKAADGGDQKFDHRYYVDGPVTLGDAYLGGEWKTTLVGTTGAGGRSVFALDVSNPTSFTAADRLWEIDDSHTDSNVARNIGHVLGKPVIAPFRDKAGVDTWVAIFGNGYDSLGTDCAVLPPFACQQNAVLFVVDLATGDVRTIKAQEAGAPAGPNGLGNIAVVDRKRNLATPVNGRDGFADTVYAADRKGALWRFDLLDETDTTLTTPLFVTQAVDGVRRQPILGGLTVTAGRAGGVMVLFGTGSFSFIGDGADTTLQSLYGIQDSGGPIQSTIPLSSLFGRGIALNIDTGARTITPGGPVMGHRGWYLDLPAGERMVSNPRVASGVVFIPTYKPTAASGCSTGGENWMYGLNTRTGAPALDGVRFDSTSGDTAAQFHQSSSIGALQLNTTGSAPVKDVGVSVLSTSRPINPGEHRCWMRITVPGLAQAMFVPYPCGRQSWRQLQ